MTVADKLQTIAENQQKVYDAGKEEAWSKIWDDIQWKGKRVDYAHAFHRWNIYSFKPKYDIRPTLANNMFRFATNNYDDGTTGETTVDLAEKIKESGIVFDLSQSTNNQGMFFFCEGITHLPVLDFSGAVHPYNEGAIRGCYYLHTIDKIIFSEKGSGTLQYMFASCERLKNVVIEGVIDQSWNLQDCRALSPDSMKSIITHLKDYSGTDNEYAYTLTFYKSRWEALEADSTSPTGGTWKEYVQSLGWNT